jgi:hypothetical protein
MLIQEALQLARQGQRVRPVCWNKPGYNRWWVRSLEPVYDGIGIAFIDADGDVSYLPSSRFDTFAELCGEWEVYTEPKEQPCPSNS